MSIITDALYVLVAIIQYLVEKIDSKLPGWGIPIFFGLLGILISTQLRNFSEAILFLTSSLILFITYVFGSRLRQRGSLLWIAIGGLFANGMWYLTLGLLDASKSYWLLLPLYTIGIVAGRMAGVNIAQYIENRYELKADATLDHRLSPEQRYKYLVKEPIFQVLLGSLILYSVYGLFTAGVEFIQALTWVIIMGFLQNSFYSIATRAGNRDNDWYIAITGILSGIPFYVGATYLLSKDMASSLFLPYVLSTTFGSVIGSFISMVVEYEKKMKPDEHLNKNYKKQEGWRAKMPYLTLVGLAIIWIFIQNPIFAYFGIPLSQLKFPLSFVTIEFPRLVIILVAGLIFFTQEALHALTSRAGNRNHQGYHLATIVPKGMVDFLKLSYMTLNDSIPEIVPIAILSSCLGSLYGKNVAIKIEIWLQARMDIEPDKPKTKSVTA